jgi:hypothetical protein
VAAANGYVGAQMAANNNTNNDHVDRMKGTFILAAISTGNDALTTAPAVNKRVWRTADQLIARRGNVLAVST